MNISEKCFNDPAIRSYISTNGKTGLCEHTGEITEVIDVIDLSDYFETFSDAFIEDKDGTPFYDKIQNEWNIFNDQCGREILEAILNELDSNIKVDTPVKYSNDIEGSASEWERIKHGLINEYRYLTVKELDGESYFEQIFAVHETQLPIGLSLYRSRINKNGEDTPYSKNEMGAPPKHLATAGRANPEGIPFLYLSSSPETTFYETRAIYLDTLSTGVFKSKRVLKIVDFAKPSSPFNPIYENVITGIICERLSKSISIDLSRPMRRHDSIVDYVPTQFICEYIKYLAKADGIAFKSSLHEGTNYVIFSPDLFQCEDIVQIHKINKVTIKE